MATTVIRTCDLCDREIPNTMTYFAADVYGREAHIECVDLLSAFQLISFLNLDEIKIMKNQDWANATHGTGRGSDWKKYVTDQRERLNKALELK